MTPTEGGNPTRIKPSTNSRLFTFSCAAKYLCPAPTGCAYWPAWSFPIAEKSFNLLVESLRQRWTRDVSPAFVAGGLERGALVVGVTLSDGRTGFWIEIQTRQGALTPLVTDDGSDPDAQIPRALNIIFSARGSNLEDHFRTASIKAYCFTHRYVSQNEDVTQDDGKKRQHKKEWDEDLLMALDGAKPYADQPQAGACCGLMFFRFSCAWRCVAQRNA